MGATGEASAERTERSWSRVGNQFQAGGFLTGTAAASAMLKQMQADADALAAAGERVGASWAKIGNQFQRGGFATGTAAAREIQSSMNAATPAIVGASKASALLRQGLVGVALQATATGGAVGRIGQAALLIGGGTTAIVAAALAVTALATAYRALTKDTADTRKAQEDLAKGLEGLGTQAQITAARIRLAQLDAVRQDASLLTVLGRGFKAALASLTWGTFGASFAEQAELLKNAAAELRTQIAGLTEDLTKPFRTALAESNQALAEAQLRLSLVEHPLVEVDQAVLRLRLQFEKYPPAIAAAIAANQTLITTSSTLERAQRASTDEQARLALQMTMQLAPIEDVNEALRVQELILANVSAADAREQAARERANRETKATVDLYRRARMDLEGTFATFFDTVAQDGLAAFRTLAEQITDIFSKLAADLAAKELFKFLDEQKLKALRAPAAGFTAGVATGSPIGGALVGAATSFALKGNPLEIAAAGVVGLVGGLLGLGDAARAARERVREFNRSLEGFRASLTGNELDDQLIALQAQADALRKQARDAGLDWGPLVARLNEISDLERQRYNQLVAAAQVERQLVADDVEARRLRATGAVREADALAFATQQAREYADAIAAGRDEMELAALRTTQVAEATRRQADLDRQRLRGMQDLQVRLSRAAFGDTGADNLAFAFAQQREYEDALLAGADAAYLATLRQVQLAEAHRRTADQLQATIDGLTTTITSLRQFTAALRVGSLAGSPITRLAESRRQFEEVLAAAKGGDQEAAGRLPEIARTFLEASRAVNASGGRFQVDLTRVLRETEAVAAMFEGQRSAAQQQLDALGRITIEIGDLGINLVPLTSIDDSTAQAVLELQDIRQQLGPLVVIEDRMGEAVAELQTVVRVLVAGLGAVEESITSVRQEQAKTTRALEGARL